MSTIFNCWWLLLSDLHDFHLELWRKMNLDTVAKLAAGADAQCLPGHYGAKVESSIGENRQFQTNLLKWRFILKQDDHHGLT